MSSPPQVFVPGRLLAEGVSIIGIGVMGAAYTTRLSSLGIPVTIFNRTGSKAAEAARACSNVTAAGSIEECVRASGIVLVACSPTQGAIGAICDPLGGEELARGKHVIFIVDCGLREARTMDEVVFQKGGAASVTNVSLVGSAMGIMQGQGFMNASGVTCEEASVTEVLMPLLGLLASAAYHPGGSETAALYAMAVHIGCMPLFYGFMHYLAVMKKGGVDVDAAVGFFQTVNRSSLDLWVPFLKSAFLSGDYSAYMGSQQLLKEIMDSASETCASLGVDERLTRLMAEYHGQAMQDPALAGKSYHSVYQVIDRP